jgi:type I restriction enzyme M protein
MGSKIDQKDINNAARAACDTFRGVVDPAQYKDYILVMLKSFLLHHCYAEIPIDL